MSNTKNKKPTPLRSNDHLPKAGPKSNGGGRHQNRERVVNLNEPSLFDRLRQDKIDEGKARREEALNRREEAKQQRLAKNREFLAAQADIARSFLTMPESSLTRFVAFLIIDNFVAVTPNEAGKFFEPGTTKEIKRTAFAELQILDQLNEEQLKHKSIVDNARVCARKVLAMAYDQLNPSQVVARQPKILEAVTA